MSINIGTESLLSSTLTKTESSTASRLERSLGSINGAEATDEEMMEACKGFESYFVEKLIETMRTTVKSEDEEENAYLQQFGDMQYQEYAKQIADSGQLGIAQKLYEAMKRQ